MEISRYIALKYLKKGSSNHAISIISKIASVGIVVGAAALFTVLSVFDGLREFSLSFANDFDPDMKILPDQGKFIVITKEQEARLAKLTGALNYSKTLEERVAFTFDEKEHLAFLKGVDSNYTAVSGIGKNIEPGHWLEPDSYQAVVGYGIARKLSLGLFDYQNAFEVYVPKPGKGTVTDLRQVFNTEVLEPVGFYFINEDLSQKYVFIDLPLAQELMGYTPEQVSGIDIRLPDYLSESALRKELTSIFGSSIVVKNRAQLNESLYRMLNTENLVLYLIFTLVIIVTLFTLIGALIMMILEKKANLKTLHSLGMPIPQIRKVFFIQGMAVCVAGSCIGLIVGSIIIILQQQFSLFMITQSMPYPVVFGIKNILIVLVTIITLGFFATRIASSRVRLSFINS